jgi:type II secretory pathway component PulF
VAALRRRLDLRFGTRKQLIQVLVYPLALVAPRWPVLAPMSVWVLPAFASMYAGASAELPLATRVVMASGRALADHAIDGPFVLAAGVRRARDLAPAQPARARRRRPLHARRSVARPPDAGRGAQRALCNARRLCSAPVSISTKR